MRIKLSPILYLLLCVTFVCSAFAVVGCNKKGGEDNKFEIKAKDPLPNIEPYKDFDMYNAFLRQEGAEYSFEGYYINDKDKSKDIVFDGSTFNISADNAVFANITVTGKKGGETVTKELSLDVKGVPDVIDEGFENLDKDKIISKKINYNPEYIKDGNSSVKVTFNGYYNMWGSQFACLMGHLYTIQDGIYDEDYYAIYKEADQSKAWEDAVMTFWVYYSDLPKNHEDTNLQIGYRFVHKTTTQLPIGATRDFEWGKAPIKNCAPNEWTQIAIRFKDLNKTTALETDMDRIRQGWKSNEEVMEISDNLNLKCAVSHEDYVSMDQKYTYSFYFDGVDILTYDDFVQKYPDYDFNSQEDENGFDYGDTITDKFFIENWRNGNKGISFEYSFTSPDAEHLKDTFYFYQWMGEGYEWNRLTEMVEIDFDNNSATSGKIVDLGDGKYRYELLFEDVPINSAEGEAAIGDETANLIWFENYETRLLTSNYKEIDSYS